MTDNRIRHIPVIKDKGMIGMVSIGDVVRALLSKTLIPNGRFLLRRFNEPAITTPPNVVCFSRRFSSIPQVIELEIDSKNEAEAAILKKLNEFVRRIIVHNSTPDWLPFAPGSSFWVPPHQITATKIANLVDKVTNPLTEEESLSLSSPYGWPCSSFFIPPPGNCSDGSYLFFGSAC
jgi:hypothetical protein